jgi:hypothetical protein
MYKPPVTHMAATATSTASQMIPPKPESIFACDFDDPMIASAAWLSSLSATVCPNSCNGENDRVGRPVQSDSHAPFLLHVDDSRAIIVVNGIVIGRRVLDFAEIELGVRSAFRTARPAWT